MNDFDFESDSIENDIYQPMRIAAANIDENPDQGARAIQLSRATGTPAPVIYPNLDRFDSDTKARMVANIVHNSPEIQQYIRSSSMAPIVSNDDYGNLSGFSQGAKQTKGFLDALDEIANPDSRAEPGSLSQVLLSGVAGGVAGAIRGFGTETPASMQWAIDTRDKVNPALVPLVNLVGLVGTTGEDIASAFGGFMGGATGAGKGAAGAAYQVFGGSKEGAEAFSRDIEAETERKLISGEGGNDAKEVLERKHAQDMAKAQEIAAAAKPYLENGMMPPRGVHPEIDKMYADANSSALDRLDEDLANAQASMTKERSPEMFNQFAEQHYGNSTIGISGDRVAELYGDRIPSADDGLLGWAPGIEDALELAKTTGEDVHIPIKDWLTHVDPAVARQLHDDIRMWPQGITAAEAAEGSAPKTVVDAPLPVVRSQGLEPMFAMGDRKISLLRDVETEKYNAQFGGEMYHEYKIYDHNKEEVGQITLVPDEATKTLHVQMMSGAAGMWANSFGPSLIRDLKRQIKELYPDFETVTGHRVTGARDAAGTAYTDLAYPKVKLAELENIDNFNLMRSVFNSAWERSFHPTVTAQVKPRELYSEAEKALVSKLNFENETLTGGKANLIPTGKITTSRGSNPLGVFISHPDRLPDVLINLFGPDPIGTHRHESIHFLRQLGFFEPREWNQLIRSSIDEDWIGQHNIEDRYPTLTKAQQHEEAIAEAFRTWAANKDSAANAETSKIFQKIQEIWESVKDRLKSILGREPTFDDIFEKVYSGEVAGREPGPPMHPDIYQGQEPKFQEDWADKLRAEAVGLDEDTFQKLRKSVEERYKSDLEASIARAEKEQKREQTKEWEENKTEIEKQVTQTIRQRPDVAADLFIGSGELQEKKLRQRYPLAEDDLTEAQKASLPDHYYAKSGLPVDSVASMFGYTSGDEMIAALGKYNAAKEGRSPQEMLRKVIDDETNRQMQAKYGNLQDNIMSEARDQALSENNLNIIAEEYQGAAMQAGISTIDKDFAMAEAKRMFGNMPMSSVNFAKLMATVEKHSQDAIKSLAGGNAADAVKSLQNRYISAVIAAEALKLQKTQAKFEAITKQFARREVKGVAPEYTNYMHDIMIRIGKPVRRSIQNIADDIRARETGTLEEFVKTKQKELREIPVWDQLYDPNWSKPYKEMTVDEFNHVHDSLTALAWNARDEMKVVLAGEKIDLETLKTRMIQTIETGEPIQYDADGQVMGRTSSIPGIKAIRGYVARSLTLENMFGRFDKFDPKGDWSRILYELIDGANQKEAWSKEYSKKLLDIKDDRDLTRSVTNNIWRDPSSGELFPMTRKHLLTIMLNAGTKMAGGYGLKSGQMMNWIHQNANKEDWDFVQKIWDNIFKDIKTKGDTMYRSLTGGVAPDSVPAQPIKTPHGTYAGGYYPIIHSAVHQGDVSGRAGGLMSPNYYKATTPNSWTKSRTFDVRPLSMSLDDMPGRINQMLHDIAMRPAVLNAKKIFYDKGIQEAIKRNYGLEWRDQLIPYLESVANSANRMTKADQAMESVSGFMRQNLISTLVGFNPGTVLKHGPSAAMTSIREVGVKNFYDAAKSMFSVDEWTGESNYDFAMNNSLELQRRERNAMETMYGASNNLVYGGGFFASQGAKQKFMSLRQTIMEYASKPVALSDKLSAVPTWLAAYKNEIESGSSHGEAVQMADRAVRRAHGSTAVTNRSAIMRDSSPWLTSLYNFFSDIMNRQMETLWKAGATIDKGKADGWAEAAKDIPALSASLFAYAIWPAIVESWVSPEPEDKKHEESWAWRAVKGEVRTLSSSWVGIRDIASALMSGRDPQSGLLGTMYKSFTDLTRDFGKDGAFNEMHRGKLIADGVTALGTATGMFPSEFGHILRYITDVNTGVEQPQGTWSWLVGLRYGTTKGH